LLTVVRWGRNYGRNQKPRRFSPINGTENLGRAHKQLSA
jgi:hypothetical protein